MWIRTQEKDRLIDCNKFKIEKHYNYEQFYDKYEKVFEEQAIKTGFKIPYVNYEIEENNKFKKIELTKNEFIKQYWEKMCEDYVVYNITFNNIILATYSTKERCLEVLDEIQQAMIGKLMIPFNGQEIHHLPTVYQMPKE